MKDIEAGVLGTSSENTPLKVVLLELLSIIPPAEVIAKLELLEIVAVAFKVPPSNFGLKFVMTPSVVVVVPRRMSVVNP